MIGPITVEKAKELLEYPEQPKFDWKRELNLSNEITKSHFVKDIVSLANAHGDETGYILYGVDPNNPEDPFLGMASSYDDANLQELVNSKLEKRVTFLYHEVLQGSKRIGVAIVLRSLSRPHIIRVDFGILKEGQIPIRKGSSNQLASTDDLMQMFYDTKRVEAVNYEKNVLRTMLASRDYALSAVALQALELAKSIGDDETAQWLNDELLGYAQEPQQRIPSYRLVKCYVSLYEMDPRVFWTPQQIIARHGDKFIEQQMWVPFTLSKIEDTLAMIDGKETIGIIRKRVGDLDPSSEYADEECYVYVFPTEYQKILIAVKERLLRFLLTMP